MTSKTRDGGYDIKAIYKDEISEFLTLVECKRYSKSNPVRISLIREFYAINELNKSSKGIIFTTSYFTKDAKDLTRNMGNRIELNDFESIKRILNNKYKSK